MTAELSRAMSTVPAGRWAVAVSGGADSVALLRLALLQPQLQLHVIHLDHETRNGGSTADAEFVFSLAASFDLPISVARLSELHLADTGNNPSARFRVARLAWFRTVVRRFDLAGVLLAHHLDDQAETIAQRLLRGRQPLGLAGMSVDAEINQVRLLRPLLGIRRHQLRQFLVELKQPWVEDSSNASAVYQRNRLRAVLGDENDLRDALLDLGSAAQSLARWLQKYSFVLGPTFEAGLLARLPKPLSRFAAGQWLRERGVPAEDLSPKICDRLISLSTDHAGPSRIDFPGPVTVLRRHGKVEAAQPPNVTS